MNIEVAKVLAIAGSIASCLVVAIVFLINWIRALVKERNDRDQKQIETLEQDIDEYQQRLDSVTEQLNAEKEARLKDSRDYANGVIALSHRFRETVLALTKWIKR